MDVYGEEELESIVDDITNSKFSHFCCLDGCNETILEGVREKVKANVVKHLKAGKSHFDIILSEQPILNALFTNEKLLYEQSVKELEEQVPQRENLLNTVPYTSVCGASFTKYGSEASLYGDIWHCVRCDH